MRASLVLAVAALTLLGTASATAQTAAGGDASGEFVPLPPQPAPVDAPAAPAASVDSTPPPAPSPAVPAEPPAAPSPTAEAAPAPPVSTAPPAVESAPAQPSASEDGFTLFDRHEGDTYKDRSYDFLARARFASGPVWIDHGLNVDGGRFYWYRTPTPGWGGAITEYNDGPLTWTWKLLLMILTTTQTKVGSDGYYDYYRTDPGVDMFGVAALDTTLSVDWSPLLHSAQFSSYMSEFVGMSFGFIIFPEFSKGSGLTNDYGVITDKTRLGRELLDNGGGYLDDTANQYPLLLLVRVPFNLPYVGGLTVAWDVPPVYAIMAPFVLFGVLEEKDKAFLYAFGVPRMSVSASRSFGPARLKAYFSVPTAYLAIPWYFKGWDAGFQVGLGF